jgi:hypothetical protein
MSVACTLALTKNTEFHFLMLSKPLPTKVKTASLALGEIPSVPEKGLRTKGRGDPGGRAVEFAAIDKLSPY